MVSNTALGSAACVSGLTLNSLYRCGRSDSRLGLTRTVVSGLTAMARAISWHYEGARQIRKNTSIRGGPKESRAAIEGWRAEFFIPYALLTPLQNVPPKAGTVWRANFYRMDHDGGKRTQWEWAPVGESFHEYQKFGELLFADR